MKRLFLCSTLFVSGLSHAASTNLNLGSGLTAAPALNPSSIFAPGRNPALASLSVRPDERFRLNYLPALSMGLEVGDVGNFIDEIDELVDLLEDPTNAVDGVQTTLDRFNSLLVNLGEEGYLKVENRLTAPIAPFYWRPSAVPGTIFLELEMNTAVRLGILDDRLSFDQQNGNFTTASSAYIKSGIEKRASLGYSQPLFGERAFTNLKGQLLGGVKVSLIMIDLSKQVMRLQHLDGKDIEDVVRDEYKENLQSDTGLSVDVGLIWAAEQYRVGLNISDINSPSFTYGAVGTDCERYTEQSVRRNNCETAAYFALEQGDIRTHETHVKHAVATVDAAWFLTPRWSVGAALDLSSTDDLVGEANQWLHTATTFNSPGIWWPDVRMGYRKNLEGSQLSTLSAGISLFDALTFDVEVALERITADDAEAPRKLAFALSFSERF